MNRCLLAYCSYLIPSFLIPHTSHLTPSFLIPHTSYLVFSYTNLLHWLQEHMLTCPSRKFFHIDCPGCGFQRSCLALLKGDLGASLSLYPATIPILILIGFTLLHLRYRFFYGAMLIKYFYVTIAIVVMVFYIYKLVTFKIAD